MSTQVTTTAYKFSELTGKAKDRAREWYARSCMDHEWWDCVYADAKEQGTERGFDIEDINFSGFWSQGDGASWEGTVDTLKFIDYHIKEDHLLYTRCVTLKELHNAGWIDSCLRIGRHGSRYSHSNTMRITDCGLACSVPDDDDIIHGGVLQGASVQALFDAIDIDDLLYDIEQLMIDEARKYADKIYDDLEKEYEGMMTDEYIADFCDANKYLFDEDGDFL